MSKEGQPGVIETIGVTTRNLGIVGALIGVLGILVGTPSAGLIVLGGATGVAGEGFRRMSAPKR